MNCALICVDVQGDFLPGGSLAVPEGNAVIPPLVHIAQFIDCIIATRDFHPDDHCSFVENGGVWPKHCVAGTKGALIDARITAIAEHVISKGTKRRVDAYSGFDSTELLDLLHKNGITELIIGGLATDYCVRATVLDAIKHGFHVTVVADGIRAVDIMHGDGALAIAAMTAAGAKVETSSQIITGLRGRERTIH